jgi:hypothetical protein
MGVDLALLAALHRLHRRYDGSRPWRLISWPLAIFGGCPLFFYMLHFYMSAPPSASADGETNGVSRTESPLPACLPSRLASALLHGGTAARWGIGTRLPCVRASTRRASSPVLARDVRAVAHHSVAPFVGTVANALW